MERSDPDNQGGFTWTVTFTSDNQDGDLPFLAVESDDTTGLNAVVAVVSIDDGSYLDGIVEIKFDNGSATLSGDFAVDATAEDVRVALEGIGTGSLAVSREGTGLFLVTSKQDCSVVSCSPWGGIVLWGVLTPSF